MEKKNHHKNLELIFYETKKNRNQNPPTKFDGYFNSQIDLDDTQMMVIIIIIIDIDPYLWPIINFRSKEKKYR